MNRGIPLIEMRGISRIYRMGEVEVPALKNVDFSVGEGEFVSLVGSSGSGKSTLMNLIGCLDRPTTGTYTLEGRDIAGMNRDELSEIRGKKIGFIFQNFNLLPRTSALENVELPLLYMDGGPDKAKREMAREALSRVGLANRLEHYPSQLSGGQQQRVAIARAIVTSPKLLLADEPTGNLDSRSGAEILGILEELNGEGTTLIIVTHDPKVASRAPRLVAMRDGEITANGSGE